jgi:DNA-binding NarL/FixJ family response regulator
MPDTFRQHARALRQRAANECDPARRYLKGLAASWEELARQWGEWVERAKRPKRPDLAERRKFVVLLRGEGHTQRQIANRLGVSQQLVNKILHAGRG